ncbi:hypothetical protein GUJ93_ZPchr0001g29897 [Zizania palustris]|uniref:Uncharacterized protein n=1 Tax=Zizania palustris TaxID=103762 RepID=A0A8J5S0D8_ZIZPA|nr:hypothetical protein GUJ93_ZPchr0001g29897 [Zizania palustris]
MPASQGFAHTLRPNHLAATIVPYAPKHSVAPPHDECTTWLREPMRHLLRRLAKTAYSCQLTAKQSHSSPLSVTQTRTGTLLREIR